VPAALAVTAGIVGDRYASIPLAFSLVTMAVGLVAWGASRAGKSTGLPLVYLALTAAALGAAYHHGHREVYAADDIGEYASSELRPTRLRGVVVEEPEISWQVANDPLRSIQQVDPTTATVQVTRLRQRDDWVTVSGRARLMVSGHLQDLHVGDQIEVVGRLVAPHGAANPGEFDYAAHLRDQRIRAQVLVQKTTEGVIRVAEGWPHSVNGWLAVVRGWGQRQLQATLSERQGPDDGLDRIPMVAGINRTLSRDYSGVAVALVLGEGSTMTNADWDKYIRTGVIHALAISGWHLVVLSGLLWLVLRVLRVRRRPGAVGVALFLLTYALLAGGRPPVLRAAVTVCACCGGILLRRPALLANSFALAWLVVAALNPTDLFTAGCQLSFLAVAVLYWGVARWFRAPTDPLERLIDESRPLWQRMLRRLGGKIALSYSVNAVVWLAATPLIASHYHLISPVALLIGPPVVLLTSVALLAGFLLLLAGAICPPVVPLFAWITRCCLAGCEWIVTEADRWPGARWYISDIPAWWLWGFYAGLFAVLTVELLRRHWRWAGLAGLTWLCAGLAAGWFRAPPDDLRCTFLAVGHGGCTVLETPDGRVLLYDAGALGGPDVTRRQIAPYLWSRGVRRIDEVFLSHADLDHFNGLPALLDRFAVGQVTLTPTFAEKATPAVHITLTVLHERHVPTRIVKAGDRLTAGPVNLDVLHPPAVGPEGNENARSLVLLVQHAGHCILLTGDLEGPGLERVLGLPQMPVDVLMAPHHGSRTANTPELAAWAKPKIVVSCEAAPRGPARPPEPYSERGAHFLGTWPHGAVIIRSGREGLFVETFQTRQRLVAGR
jgi:competence protein ComEC